jgi:chemosensory pili system protein ChpA (sensor histidine kinase/response regulator)
MSKDKEREIRLQFLDEAQEYLGSIESALLGVSSRGVDVQAINAALRAAHSIKGGAGMMGFQTLSELAHRTEDSFKVLKTQKGSLEIDAELEQLLLGAVDCLGHIIECDRQGFEPDPTWLEGQIEAVFDQLHDRLGEPQAEDASTILSPEEGQDVIPLFFQTEVEGCLQRLESVLANQDPCLREELEILAQELGGLGEMLQLEAFTQLCNSVAHHLQINPDGVEEIAQSALQAWRRSQALVLTGNFVQLPTHIGDEATVSALSSDVVPLSQPEFTDTEVAIASEFAEDAEFDTETAFAESDVTDAGATDLDAAASEDVTEPEVAAVNSWQLANLSMPETAITPEVYAETPAAESNARSRHRVIEVKPDSGTRQESKDHQDTTVRVQVSQLNQLNDLFGELTIERNGLDLQIKRLRDLLNTLKHRVQVLEQSNTRLRSAYDHVAPPQIDFLSSLPSWVTAQEALHEDTAVMDEGDRSNRSTRSDSNDLQTLRHRFDALEMDRYDDLHLLSQEMIETIVQIQEVTSDFELNLEDTEQTFRGLNKTAKQLQLRLTQVRMRPLSDIVDRFPRAIRELSLKHDKPVELKVYGANTLIDRNILEALNDPMMHLLRNAFDHGIEQRDIRRAAGKPEQGVIEIRATHRNNRTLITIRDDGGGIPLDKIRARARAMGLDEMLLSAASDEELISLIFEPGFSTNEGVTDLSGRGVGMDVVRDRLKHIRGDIKVDTEAGVGTTFTLSVPFTLSVARILLAETASMLLAFPTDVIEEMVVFQPENVIETAGTEVLSWQDQLVQIVRLKKSLRFNCPRSLDKIEATPSISTPTLLIVNHGNQIVGIEVERCWGEQEVAIRRVEGNLPLPEGFSSCTILGDGRVVPLVNLPELLHWIASDERTRNIDANQVWGTQLGLPEAYPSSVLAPDEPEILPILPLASEPTILIVDDSINVRRFLALTLEKAGYRVEQAKDGQDALDKLNGGLNVQAIICDIEMPRLDGYGFLARVKSSPIFQQIPIAMLTSRSGEKHRQLAMNLGASAYFAKPYNEQNLLRTLEEIVNPTAVNQEVESIR